MVQCRAAIFIMLFSMGEGNVFTGACHPFCQQGGGLLPELLPGGGGGGRGVWSGGSLPPTPEMASAAVGTHPIGIHSCLERVLVMSG